MDITEGLEEKIVSLINRNNSSNCTVDFVYSPGENQMLDLYIVTRNPINKSTFLFAKSFGISKQEALKKCLNEIQFPKKIENSYTVSWKKKGENSFYVSYFTGNNPYDVLDKFFYQKDKEDYIIFGINLNPIS